MFITDTDYRVVIGDSALKVISQASQDIRDYAEAEAIEEIASYLRPTYDTKAIFTQSGDSRNRYIVMIAADMALYHMAACLPNKMGIEIRKERYDRAIKWLEGVQAGKIIPDIPVAEEQDGQQQTAGILYGSQKQLRHNW